MKITCDNCQQILEKYLCDIPSEWRSDIAKVICEAITQDYTLGCDGVEGCQTLTTLSAFSVSNNIASVTYTDEDGTSFTRMFSISQILNNSISSVNPKCIAPVNEWSSWTYQRKLQAIIEYKCRCCEKATTTTTTTTSAPTTTSTTSTTTIFTTTTTSTSTTSTTTSAPVTTTTTTIAPTSTTTTTTFCGNVTDVVIVEITSTTTTTTLAPTTTSTTTAAPTTTTTTTVAAYSANYDLSVTEGDVCTSPVGLLLWTNTTFGPGAVMYTDSGLTTPVTGYNFIKEGSGSIIYNINSGSGLVGSTTGNSC